MIDNPKDNLTFNLSDVIIKFFLRLKKIVIVILGLNRRAKRIANSYVRDYYRKNYSKDTVVLENYWKRNKYWDYFYHSLPHAEKSIKYVPRDYYAIKVDPILNNNYIYSDFINEKNYYDLFFARADIIYPKTFIHCISNNYYDSEYGLIDEEKAKKITEIIDSDIIVKSSLSSSGSGVKKFYKRYDGFVDYNNQAFDFGLYKKLYHGNYLIQECISQHPELSKYNKDSLNTIRIITYKSVANDKVNVISAMLRIGVGKMGIDNVSSGGIAVSIHYSQSGVLGKYAFDKYGKSFITHPISNIAFEGQLIPEYDEISKKARYLGEFIAHARVIGWDLTVSPEGKVILIEPNIGIGAWMSQIADGRPLFGKYSDEVREYIKNQHD